MFRARFKMTFKAGDRIKFPSESGKTWTYGNVVELHYHVVIIELDNGVQIGANPKDLTKVTRRQRPC